MLRFHTGSFRLPLASRTQGSGKQQVFKKQHSHRDFLLFLPQSRRTASTGTFPNSTPRGTNQTRQDRSHFTEEETEARRGAVTCLRSHRGQAGAPLVSLPGQLCSLGPVPLSQCPGLQETHTWDHQAVVRTRLPRGPRQPFLSPRAPPSARLAYLLKASSGHGAEAMCLHPRVSLVVQGHALASEKPCFSLPFYEHSFC